MNDIAPLVPNRKGLLSTGRRMRQEISKIIECADRSRIIEPLKVVRKGEVVPQVGLKRCRCEFIRMSHMVQEDLLCQITPVQSRTMNRSCANKFAPTKSTPRYNLWDSLGVTDNAEKRFCHVATNQQQAVGDEVSSISRPSLRFGGRSKCQNRSGFDLLNSVHKPRQKFAVSVDQLIVAIDFAAIAEFADHIPMDGGFVDATGFV